MFTTADIGRRVRVNTGEPGEYEVGTVTYIYLDGWTADVTFRVGTRADTETQLAVYRFDQVSFTHERR